LNFPVSSLKPRCVSKSAFFYAFWPLLASRRALLGADFAESNPRDHNFGTLREKHSRKMATTAESLGDLGKLVGISKAKENCWRSLEVAFGNLPERLSTCSEDVPETSAFFSRGIRNQDPNPQILCLTCISSGPRSWIRSLGVIFS
jgi:hypothetical protein